MTERAEIRNVKKTKTVPYGAKQTSMPGLDAGLEEEGGPRATQKLKGGLGGKRNLATRPDLKTTENGESGKKKREKDFRPPRVKNTGKDRGKPK